MEQVDKIITSGASIASLLHSVATSNSDFDGLLLGRVVRKTKSLTTDETEFDSQETKEAFLSGFLCNGSVCTFYTPIGDINEATVKKLQTSSNGSIILGWFVFRAGMGFTPTMRESRVCSQFWHLRRNANLPVLFAIMSTCKDHGGATTIFQAKILQQVLEKGSKSKLVFKPLHMQIDNIGTTISHKRYEDVSHLCIIPSVANYHTIKQQKDQQKSSVAGEATPPDNFGGGKLHQLAVEGVYQQVQGIEELYKNILRKVDSLSREVCTSSAELSAQMAKIRQLEDALHQAQNRPLQVGERKPTVSG